MEKIYNNLNIENLTRTEWFNQFNKEQRREIRWGLESDIDISKYAKPEFDANQMEKIRIGLSNDVDATSYITPEFEAFQIK